MQRPASRTRGAGLSVSWPHEQSSPSAVGRACFLARCELFVTCTIPRNEQEVCKERAFVSQNELGAPGGEPRVFPSPAIRRHGMRARRPLQDATVATPWTSRASDAPRRRPGRQAGGHVLVAGPSPRGRKRATAVCLPGPLKRSIHPRRTTGFQERPAGFLPMRGFSVFFTFARSPPRGLLHDANARSVASPARVNRELPKRMERVDGSPSLAAGRPCGARPRGQTCARRR